MEIKHDGTINKIIIPNKNSLHNSTLKIWSEDKGLECLQPFEYILKTE